MNINTTIAISFDSSYVGTYEKYRKELNLKARDTIRSLLKDYAVIDTGELIKGPPKLAVNPSDVSFADNK